MSDPQQAWMNDSAIDEIRREMIKFAQSQLRDATMAEDVVQEALVAALANAKEFAGRSALKTWVFAILRNKIIDMLRARNSGIRFVETDASTDAHFDADGHWAEESWPAAWGDPEQSLEAQQFWAVFEACLERLQESAARAFMLREMMGFETAEICATLQISTSNCGVLLHRARIALRACLEHTWFLNATQAK